MFVGVPELCGLRSWRGWLQDGTVSWQVLFALAGLNGPGFVLD